MQKLAWGLRAWALAGAMLASHAYAVPAQEVAGSGGAAGAAGFGGTLPGRELRAVNLGKGIPVGGAILLTGGGTASAPIVKVTAQDAPQTTIGGSVHRFESSEYWIWTPSQPLIAGMTYVIRASAPDLGLLAVTATFEAVPAIALEPPRLVSEPSLSSIDETTNTECCRRFFGAGVLEPAPCFPSEQQRSLMLNPGLSTPDPAVLLGQFLFRIKPGGRVQRSEPLEPTQWPTWVPVMFYEQADVYCFEVEAIELRSGTAHSYPDIPRCVPHGELPALGVEIIEPGAAELDRAVCHAPPLAYEGPWCTLNEDPCAQDANAPGCALYGYVCRDEPLPPDPHASVGSFAGGEGGAAGMVSAGGRVDAAGMPAGAAGSAGGRSVSSASEAGGSDDGCSIAAASGSGRGAGMLGWWSILAALALAARRGRGVQPFP